MSFFAEGPSRERAKTKEHAALEASYEFGTLRSWLRDNLYRHGSKFAPNDLVKRAIGAVMQMRPYLDYLHGKYGALYRLPGGAI